ncbi:S8 family serine peptidase [Saccharopolyspora sp. NPDC003752]
MPISRDDRTPRYAAVRGARRQTEGLNAAGQPGACAETGAPVELVAPGEGVVSIGPGGAGHWQGSGTAYATPFVSATAALVRSYRPELTADQVAQRLLATANPSGGTIPDPNTGSRPGRASPGLAPRPRGRRRGRGHRPPLINCSAPSPDVLAWREQRGRSQARVG